jgi:hypothetical protein
VSCAIISTNFSISALIFRSTVSMRWREELRNTLVVTSKLNGVNDLTLSKNRKQI